MIKKLISTYAVCTSDSDSSDDEKFRRFQDYIHALEEERCKIQVFHRELPLCLQLVSQAIETCKQQLLSGGRTSSEYNFIGQSAAECNSELTSMISEEPVLEEFIPLKRTTTSSTCVDVDDDQELKTDNSKKSDWLRSAQLWNSTPDPPSNQESARNHVSSSVVKINRDGIGGAFHPYQKEKSDITTPQEPIGMLATAASSVEEIGGSNKEESKEGQFQRKPRRSWSPELHRKFLQALQRLGGSQVATPKQIRDLMKVDGLTNDEVKSHLQKYRLHRRRPAGHNLVHNNGPQAAQLVMVAGGIWAPPQPQEYAAMATNTATATCNRVYAPIASRPPLHRHASTIPYKQFHFVDDQASRTNDKVQSRSSTASSSTIRQTNNSPVRL